LAFSLGEPRQLGQSRLGADLEEDEVELDIRWTAIAGATLGRCEGVGMPINW
jgi:hypothetical protein